MTSRLTKASAGQFLNVQCKGLGQRGVSYSVILTTLVGVFSVTIGAIFIKLNDFTKRIVIFNN